MPTNLHILGIRHHGPGSARMVRRALELLKPDAVLIEGPPDAAEILPLAAHDAMKPPVALLVYDPDEPSDASYYPFAEFSPEWQAARWALKHGAQVRFIDLPRAMRPAKPEPAEPPVAPEEESPQEPREPVHAMSRDPLDALASAAGYGDGEAWWGRLIEERRGEEDPLAVFAAIQDAMAAARDQTTRTPDHDEPHREAFMRRSLRAAIKEGFATIAVICGAWHAPALTEAALKQRPAKADEETLKGLPKRKTASTWVPWTYDRLSMESGYGAGVTSPGWYHHLWVYHDDIAETWLTRVARLMRAEDLDASSASVIESVRLASTLAALRGHALPGLEELSEATLSILCHGNPLPMRVIERKLIVSQRLGAVPDEAPAVPLQRDLAAQQKSLRMKVTAEDTELDLDQRKELDLARSRLLHRLCVLEMDWGQLAPGRSRTSTFHEVWKLRWKPELSVAVIVAARWGNTVEQAASNRVRSRAEAARELPELTALLDHVMLADLPQAVEALIARIQAVSAVASDVGHLMNALPPLVSILRYGNVRRTDVAIVEPLVSGIVSRLCAGLFSACGSLDDDAAAVKKGEIDRVNEALTTLARPELLAPWRAELARLGDAEIHGLIAGRSWRHLLDAQFVTPEAAAARLTLALSPGAAPDRAAAWLEGFLAGAGALLVHDPRLLAIIDGWVASLSAETFEAVCPLARRTFSTFEKPERRQIGDTLKRGLGPAASHASEPSEDYDPARGALVDPVLTLILGELDA